MLRETANVAYRVTGPSVEVAPLHQLWARTCHTASVFSGRDGQQLITDFWQKLLSPVEMGCSSSIGFCTGQFCTACPCYSTILVKSLAYKTEANLSYIHSVTFAQDKLISQKEMALGDAGLQQTMKKILVIGEGKDEVSLSFFILFAHKNKLH